MRRIIYLMALIIVTNSFPVQAVEYSKQRLESLFTTPSERRALNTLRKGVKPAPSEQVFSGPASVHINGIVSRSGGNSVVWVNGKNTLKNSMVDGVKVYSDAMTQSHNIPVMIDGRRVYIKPGESWSDKTDADKDDL